ncbi:hypothetical protein MYX84_02220 [Acidobacteria bacterium AH-259-O06]|nr:hypothetical protein [Acidobacteria bacterium AH-259-O06]
MNQGTRTEQIGPAGAKGKEVTVAKGEPLPPTPKKSTLPDELTGFLMSKLPRETFSPICNLRLVEDKVQLIDSLGVEEP